MSDKAKRKTAKPNPSLADKVLRSDLTLINNKSRSMSAKRSDRTFVTLNEPCNVTIVKNKSYKNKPLIGEEEFSLVRAYEGKTEKIIFVFKPRYEADYDFMEMPADKCMSRLDGFASLLKDIRGSNITEDVVDMKESEVAKLHEETFKKAKVRYDDSEFGSW